MKVDDEAAIAAKKAAAKVMGFAQCVVSYFCANFFQKGWFDDCFIFHTLLVQLLVFSIDLGGMASSLWQPCKFSPVTMARALASTRSHLCFCFYSLALWY